MADCCGAKRCTCTLVAGPGVEIDGGGSTTNPYVISAPGGSSGTPTVIQAGDTPTVDTTVTGSGTTADPVIVSSVVRLDATPPAGGANLIQSGPDGLFIECDQVRDCFAAGEGIAYDPATGEIAARPSTDAGNTLGIGSDGGLFAPGGSGGTPTIIQAGDTPTVDTTVTGAGTAADPVIVSSTVRLDTTPPGGGANLIQAGPDGLYAELETGCGLTGDGSSGAPLGVLPSAQWPDLYTCPIDTAAGNVFCDPATGELRTDPPFWTAFEGDQANTLLATPIPVPTTPSEVIDTISITITNPDTCRPAMGFLFREVDLDFQLPPNSGGMSGIDGDDMNYFGNTGSGTIFNTHSQDNKITVLTLGPGETRTITMNVEAGRGSGGATITRIQKSLRAWVFSNRHN